MIPKTTLVNTYFYDAFNNDDDAQIYNYNKNNKSNTNHHNQVHKMCVGGCEQKKNANERKNGISSYFRIQKARHT